MVQLSGVISECQPGFQLTKDTLYLALTEELWGIYCEDLGEHWQCNNGTVYRYIL